MNLDNVDKKILHELDNNARISYSEISKKIRLSKNSVINRIRLLEKEKIILGYSTLVNINSLGYTTYDIYLKFKNTSIEIEKDIIDKAISNKEIWLVAKVEGNISLSLLISTKTPEEFEQIWTKFYSEIKVYVEVIRIAILLEYHHFSRKYLLNKVTDNAIVIGKRENKSFDEIDRDILKILSINSRTSLLEISKKLDLTPKTVASRIKRLEKNDIILGYKVNLNFGKIGYTYYKIMLTLNDLSIKNRLYNYIKLDKNVVYYDKFIGGTDFEFDLEIESFEKFLQFIDLLKQSFGKYITTYQYLNPTIIYKSQYFV